MPSAPFGGGISRRVPLPSVVRIFSFRDLLREHNGDGRRGQIPKGVLDGKPNPIERTGRLMMAAHRDGVGMIPVGVIGRVWKTVFFRNGVIHRGAIQSRVRCSFMPVSRTLPLVAIFRLALPVLTRMGMNRRLGMPLALLAAGT